MSLQSMLRQRMQILKADPQRRHGGDHEYKYDASGPAYACDVQPVEAQKRVTLLAMDIQASHVLRWNPADVTLGANERIKVNDATFKVASLEQPIGQRPGWPAKAFILEARL